jgi:hypothetical protein
MDTEALTPQAPMLEPQELEAQAVGDAHLEDKKVAAPYFHTSWATVEQDILDTVEMLRQPPSADLIATEYKIEGLANQKAAQLMTNLLDRIKHAVATTERTGEK